MLRHLLPLLYPRKCRIVLPSSTISPQSSSTSSNARNELLVVTENAVNQLRQIASPGEHLRIKVDSGGCSGFEYKMELDRELDEREDEILRLADGATVVVDKISLEFVRGSKLDYVEDLMRAAFRISENPKASNGCSCGASFAPKEMAE